MGTLTRPKPSIHGMAVSAVMTKEVNQQALVAGPTRAAWTQAPMSMSPSNGAYDGTRRIIHSGLYFYFLIGVGPQLMRSSQEDSITLVIRTKLAGFNKVSYRACDALVVRLF